MTNLPQSPDIGQNSDRGIYNFWISGQFCIIKNFDNSIANHDIDMKLGPAIKLDKKNTATSKTFDNYIILVNSDAIVFFSIYGQFAVIQKLDSRCMVYKTYIFNNNNFLLAKTKNGTKKSLTQLSAIALSKGTIFTKKY